MLRKHGLDEMVYNMVGNTLINNEHHIRWSIEGFKYALKHEIMNVAISLWDRYHSTYDRSSEELMEAVLICFKKSSFYIELKFYILD